MKLRVKGIIIWLRDHEQLQIGILTYILLAINYNFIDRTVDGLLTFAIAPFSEDEYLTVQFKSWARQDLEHLNIKKAQDFVNTKLLNTWTVQQLDTEEISYLVSEYIVSRWMKEAGFKYEIHKKTYYVDRHEDEDVVEYRTTYIDDFFKSEVYEHCWIQLSKKAISISEG